MSETEQDFEQRYRAVLIDEAKAGIARYWQRAAMGYEDAKQWVAMFVQMGLMADEIAKRQAAFIGSLAPEPADEERE